MMLLIIYCFHSVLNEENPSNTHVVMTDANREIQMYS